MCGRYTNTQRRSDEIQQRLADTLGVRAPESERGFGRFNIAPTDEVLAVVDDREGRRTESLRWGLVPHWAKEPKTRFSMINARAETLAERRAYRGLVDRSRHRCLVLADGWYEWQRADEAAAPAAALLADGRRALLLRQAVDALALARGQRVSSCTIVTCEANELARPIHDRMPVVLADADGWDAWLDPALDGQAVSELLQPLASDRLVVRHANPILNSARHEGPDCLVVARAA
jgi:putative SOS response-associated peptidase YedK